MQHGFVATHGARGRWHDVGEEETRGAAVRVSVECMGHPPSCQLTRTDMRYKDCVIINVFQRQDWSNLLRARHHRDGLRALRHDVFQRQIVVDTNVKQEWSQ